MYGLREGMAGVREEMRCEQALPPFWYCAWCAYSWVLKPGLFVSAITVMHLSLLVRQGPVGAGVLCPWV